METVVASVWIVGDTVDGVIDGVTSVVVVPKPAEVVAEKEVVVAVPVGVVDSVTVGDPVDGVSVGGSEVEDAVTLTVGGPEVTDVVVVGGS